MANYTKTLSAYERGKDRKKDLLLQNLVEKSKIFFTKEIPKTISKNSGDGETWDQRLTTGSKTFWHKECYGTTGKLLLN